MRTRGLGRLFAAALVVIHQALGTIKALRMHVAGSLDIIAHRLTTVLGHAAVSHVKRTLEISAGLHGQVDNDQDYCVDTDGAGYSKEGHRPSARPEVGGNLRPGITKVECENEQDCREPPHVRRLAVFGTSAMGGKRT